MVVANGAGGAGDGKKPITDETKPKEPETGTASEKKERKKGQATTKKFRKVTARG